MAGILIINLQRLKHCFSGIIDGVRSCKSRNFSRESFSQEGEDLVLVKLISDLSEGFYVEVGAHHPFRFSNTFLFYKKGWSGVCVDPLPGTRRLFKKYRPRDIFIEMGVSEKRNKLTYFMFDEPAYNTFDENVVKLRINKDQTKLRHEVEVGLDTLTNILDRNLAIAQKISFFSVDVEGFDLSVLRSNDWKKYRPDLVVAECIGVNLRNIMDDPLVSYMSSVDYTAYSKLGQSVIFAENSYITHHL